MGYEVQKFQIKPQQSFIVQLPETFRILEVTQQQSRKDVTAAPVFYALVNPQAPSVYRDFYVFATGQQIPEEVVEKNDYLGTFTAVGGSLFFHLFGPREGLGLNSIPGEKL